MKTLIIVYLLALPCMLVSQNLVKNPSFELFTNCPIGNGFNQYVIDWHGLGAAQYFNACAPTYSNGIPINGWGYQDAHSGNAYASVLVYYYDVSSDVRGYIEGRFTEPLKKDTLYCVSYYVNNIDIADGAIKNLDAYISDTLVDNPIDSSTSQPIELPAQIRSQQLLTDSINWTRVSGLYRAHGGERFIVIGNFNTNENTTKIQYNPAGMNLPYYIDDVSVVKAGIDLQSPDLGQDTVICRSALPIPLSAPPGYDAYEWNNGAVTRSTEAIDQGTYWVKCIINGCGELYDAKIIAFDTPLLELGKDTVICKGESIVIPAQSGFSQYHWSTGDTTQTIKIAIEGVYTLHTSDRCGTQADTINVHVDTIPVGLIKLGNDTTMCLYGKDMPVVLTANIPLPNYSWNTGETTWQITVAERGVYKLQSRFRCGIISDSIFVDECPPTIFFPNAFTPDNNGKNDVFRAVVVNTRVNHMIIYDRWGQKIFESNDQNTGWDGTFNLMPSPAGLYSYVVAYSDAVSDYKIRQMRGTVMLLR